MPAGAHAPIVNVIGQHATYHLRYDTPLASGIEGIAWLRTSVEGVGEEAIPAIAATITAPGQIATLVVPADIAWSEDGSLAALPELS
jgi:acetolactate synthase-1/2/3 large subunit